MASTALTATIATRQTPANTVTVVWRGTKMAAKTQPKTRLIFVITNLRVFFVMVIVGSAGQDGPTSTDDYFARYARHGRQYNLGQPEVTPLWSCSGTLT